MIDWDLQLVVPLWQGSGEPGIAAGAIEFAAQLAPSKRVRFINGDAEMSKPFSHSSVASSIKNHDAVEAHIAAASRLLEDLQPRTLLTLGGDCTVEVASVSHLASIYPDLRVVWIDAHADLNTPESSPSGLAHGMPLRALLGEGHPQMVPSTTLSPARCVLLGTRSMDLPEQVFATEHELAIIDPTQLQSNSGSLERFLGGWLPTGAPLYVHLDLDVIDPAAWPAVAVPEPGGIDIDTLITVIHSLRGHGSIVGVGITEYMPSVEHSFVTLRPVLEALGVTLHNGGG